ncbi:D-2-hydroxyacid dehydrogenase [Roseococcus sp. SYP-B2431]|uniref:D-2-hydroxyacid dehydrogenase n=1 Tax=Roseococcus sp. SYP-B2431 TaxID=2496640 RepID=UPI00103D9B3B|nr:D-2-hydroxyacid dehydrogenase [Roseococcus sp. SYP-B2431]TCH96947.1 D-2-hydroxyacid dehydrogenase [Roseococcus sp. SYP-B2431]
MTNRARVLLWTDTPKDYVAAIEAAGLAPRVQVETLPRAQAPSEAQLAETEILLGWVVPAGVLPRMGKLRWAQALMAGVEGWLALPDLPADLLLTSARGTHGDSMPENILGALFHLTKPYAAAAEAQKESRWERRVPVSLNGKTLGILGLGAIGQELAKIATALRMQVIGTRRNPAPAEGVSEVLPPERTDEVLARSDFVVLLLPSTAETENFIDAGRLARMKPGAWLLNFGRGSAIVDADLVAAVEGGRIAGALLDVFRQEPLPASHPFWTTRNIKVIPHVGGMHAERDKAVARLFVENLRRFLEGKPLLAVVDRAAGY